MQYIFNNLLHFTPVPNIKKFSVCPSHFAFKRNGSVDFTTEISNCVREVEEWSEVNGLKLSSTKTGSHHVSSRHRLSNLILTQNVYGILVHATKTYRGLGVTLNKFMF